MRYLAESPAPHLGVRELAKALDMQPSTVSRLLSALHAERFVQRDPKTGGYSPHLELMRLGLLISQKLDVRKVARPHMDAIVAACDESVFLGVYDPATQQMLRVESVQSSNPLRYVVELDKWTEVYQGASGLGIVAFLAPDERESILELADQNATGDKPWLRRTELEPLLETFREQGYAITHGRRKEGAVGVSAPIFDAGGGVVGDVILTIPNVRFESEREPEYASLVIEAADAITADIGGVRPRP